MVVDVANAPSFDDDPVMEFFTTSTKNLVSAAKAADVGHYVAVSIVGCDQLPESGYMRAKVAQEKLVEHASIPYSIVRATQFAEFTDAITASLTVGDEVRVPDALIQPISTTALADEIARVAEAPPLNGVENVGGPDKITFRADGSRRSGEAGRSQDRRRRSGRDLLRCAARNKQPRHSLGPVGRRQRLPA